MWQGAWFSFVVGFIAVLGMTRLFRLKVGAEHLGRMAVLSLAIAIPTWTVGALNSSEGFSFGAAAVAAGLTTAVLSLPVFARLKRTNRVLESLRDPRRRPEVLGLLEQRVSAKLATPELAQKHAAEVVGLSTTLISIGEDRLADAWLRRLDFTRLDPTTRAMAANNAAVAAMNLQDLAAARAALEAAPADLEPPTRAALESTHALLLALEGSYEQALEKADALASDRYRKRLDATLIAIRATAHATMGESPRAEEILSDGASTHGSILLELVVKRGGPAADIARKLLDHAGTPYR